MDQALDIATDPETGDLLYQPKLAAPPAVRPDRDVPLISKMGPTAQAALVDLVTENITYDERGQDGRARVQKDFIELLGIGKESEPDDEDEDDNASDKSDHPLLLTALLRFQSKALSSLLPTDDTAVRTKPTIDFDAIEDPVERETAEAAYHDAARRVSDFYTEYLFERLDSYEEDTDQILHDMGLFGLGIRKISVDRTNTYTPVQLDHVPLEDLIVSYDTRNLRRGRLTHRMRMSTPDVVRRIMTGQYRPAKLYSGGAMQKPSVTEARDAAYGLGAPRDTEAHTIYESFCELFLEDDEHPLGLARPYVVTVHAPSHQLLAVQRNWRAADELEEPIEHFVAYPYHPGKNAALGVGLGDLLGNVTRALRKAQRRAFEAAYLQNHPSGFKLASMSVRDEATRVRRGQFIDIDSPTQDIRAALMPHPFQGPSPGLLTLAERLEANGKELGGIASIDFAELMKSGVAAGPAMAAFEESTEFQTAVHRRLYKAHRKELKLLHDRMREVYAGRPVVFGDGRKALTPTDLQDTDLVPYMKPGQASRQKTIMEAQAVYDLSKDMPDVVHRRKAAEEFLRALGKANVDELLMPDPEEEQPEPADPITEYGMILAGKPVVAGPAQNHQAHIDAHAAQFRMLQTSQLPLEQGEAAAAALAAHIAEHMGVQMLVEVAARLGVPPEQLTDQNPEVEMQMAMAVAQEIAAIEAERRPQEGAADTRVEATRMKAQADIEKETMRQRHERQMQDLKHAQALELQREKDAAAMDRELEDNAAAIAIAGKRSAAAAASSGAGAGAKPAAAAGNGIRQ